MDSETSRNAGSGEKAAGHDPTAHGGEDPDVGDHAEPRGQGRIPARQLLQVGRTLVSDLDTPAVFDRVLQAAREVTGARYAALGVLDEERRGLERFVTRGVGADTYRAIGELPSGKGVLGALIRDPRPLRLRDVSEHPLSYGMPSGHPPMRSFLGVPVTIRGEAWGNLYLTDKQGADEFSEADEEAVVILAEWAGVAIENASLYERSEHRRAQLEQAVQGLEATRDIAVAIGGATALSHVLELVAKRGRALVQARAMLIMLREGESLVVAASAGHAVDVQHLRLPIAASTAGQVLRRGRPQRISEISSQMQVPPALLGVSDAHTALLMPMLHGGETIGVIAAFDRGAEAGPFTDGDEQLLQTFAASAANAVASAQTVQADRLRSTIAAADAERKRWARELHDETLQILGGLRVLLTGALRHADPHRYERAMREAVGGIEDGIAGLRAIIADLRPAALDELGLEPAIEALLDQRRDEGLQIDAEIEISHAAPVEQEMQTTIYRLVQEALTNVVKHAQARSVKVAVAVAGGEVLIEVSDDGVGFDIDDHSPGFGLTGMRERVELAGGSLHIHSDGGGTRFRASLPTGAARRRASGLDAGRSQGRRV